MSEKVSEIIRVFVITIFVFAAYFFLDNSSIIKSFLNNLSQNWPIFTSMLSSLIGTIIHFLKLTGIMFSVYIVILIFKIRKN